MQTESHSTITYIGYTDWRNQFKRFGIKEADRFQGVYCIGKTGTGKSTLIRSMALQDIRNGAAVCIVDPHGDLATEIVALIPSHRIADLLYMDTTRPEHSIRFNPLQVYAPEHLNLQATEIVSCMQQIWHDSWGVRMAYILRYAILTLLSRTGSTVLDIQPLLLDREQRTEILREISNPVILSFWQNEYERYTPSFRHEIISSILNKTGVFAADTAIREIMGHQDGISLVAAINTRKILIVNLSKGSIGDAASALLGKFLVTSLQMAVMQRARVPFTERVPFFLYLDEAHNYMSGFASLLSECRKYKLGLFLAHQYLDQLSDDVRSAIFGNIGTIIAFRLGIADARVLNEEMYPVFSAEDFMNLGRFHFYIKLLIDGMAAKPFSAVSGEP
jgi:hypothetical protein